MATAIYRCAPSSTRRRAARALFCPDQVTSRWDRLWLQGENARMCALNEAQRQQGIHQRWAGASGAEWIEAKRQRYARGQMGQFLEMRQPFEELACAVIGVQPPGTHVVDVGTGCGQLLMDVAERLPAMYRYTGIDINALAIERNREEASRRGLAHRVAFDVGDAVAWFAGRAASTEPVVLVSVATFKFFTRHHVQRLLDVVKQSHQQGAVLLLEDVCDDFDTRAASAWTGSLGMSHNYPELFRDAGYDIRTMDIQQRSGSADHIRFAYMCAGFAPEPSMMMEQSR